MNAEAKSDIDCWYYAYFMYSSVEWGITESDHTTFRNTPNNSYGCLREPGLIVVLLGAGMVSVLMFRDAPRGSCLCETANANASSVTRRKDGLYQEYMDPLRQHAAIITI